MPAATIQLLCWEKRRIGVAESGGRGCCCRGGDRIGIFPYRYQRDTEGDRGASIDTFELLRQNTVALRSRHNSARVRCSLLLLLLLLCRNDHTYCTININCYRLYTAVAVRRIVLGPTLTITKRKAGITRFSSETTTAYRYDFSCIRACLNGTDNSGRKVIWRSTPFDW